jgi:16S rRNA (uracil1498-N3)-methyltransferase
MADRFYTNSALSPGPVVLQGPEAHHLATVRRFRPGDIVVLFNGDGNEYAAEILNAGRKNVSLQVLRVEQPRRELDFRLEVAAPLPKGDRGDFLIEKLTELGVTDFVPLQTDRSVVHPRDTKLERLQRTVIEASKQCGRNVLMQIHQLVVWNDYCRRDSQAESRLLAHPAAGASIIDRMGNVCVAVGPEGGFTDDEVGIARSAGWRLVSLGPRVLRVETAALALATLLAVKL